MPRKKAIFIAAAAALAGILFGPEVASKVDAFLQVIASS